MIKYSILLDKEHMFFNLIELELDSTGKLSKDFDKVLPSTNPNRKKRTETYFNLTYKQGMEICRKNGLIETDSTKAEPRLIYGNKTTDPSPGDFLFEVAQKYGEKIERDSTEKTEITLYHFSEEIKTTYYNVWRIDPWTAELLENKQMKVVSKWSKYYNTWIDSDYLEIDK